MDRFNDFLEFAESHNYILDDFEKEVAKALIGHKLIPFPRQFGRKFNINLILEYYNSKNLYKNKFNYLNI